MYASRHESSVIDKVACQSICLAFTINIDRSEYAPVQKTDVETFVPLHPIAEQILFSIIPKDVFERGIIRMTEGGIITMPDKDVWMTVDEIADMLFVSHQEFATKGG